MYALCLAEDGRILHITKEEFVTNVENEDGGTVELLEGYVLVEEFPEGNVTEYRYVDGEYIYDPLPVAETVPTQLDVIEAQVTYTAMMTNTLLEV